MVNGKSSSRPGTASVTKMCRRSGWIGSSTPASFATSAAHGPPAFTTVRAPISSSFVRTPLTLLFAQEIAVRAAFSMNVTPASRARAT